MAKQSYWIVGGEAGTHAQVVGADVRDQYLRDGWAVADELPADGWVYMWHEGVSEPGRVSVAALEGLWSKRGWVAGPPPAGEHPITDVAAVTAPSAEPPAEPKPKPADAGELKKEKSVG